MRPRWVTTSKQSTWDQVSSFVFELHSLGCSESRNSFSLKCSHCFPGFNATSVSAGLHHTCSLRSDNNVVCWGFNPYGQLGVGSIFSVGDDPNEMGDALKTVPIWSGIFVEDFQPYKRFLTRWANLSMECHGQVASWSTLKLAITTRVQCSGSPIKKLVSFAGDTIITASLEYLALYQLEQVFQRWGRRYRRSFWAEASIDTNSNPPYPCHYLVYLSVFTNEPLHSDFGIPAGCRGQCRVNCNWRRAYVCSEKRQYRSLLGTK